MVTERAEEMVTEGEEAKGWKMEQRDEEEEREREREEGRRS